MADHPHGELRVGDRVVAVVRPEDVEISAPAADGGGVNRVAAMIDDRVNVGGQVRAVARTPGGLELVAQRPRSSLSADALDVHPGHQVELSWDASAVHVYDAPRAAESS